MRVAIWATPHRRSSTLCWAKLICTSGAYAAAIERTLHALDEFHIGGLQTNVHQLRAILSHPPVQAGDARTSLLTEAPEIISGSFSAAEGSPLALLEQQAAKMGKTGVVALSSVQSFQSSATRMPALEVAEGQETVECPLESAVAEIRVREGDTVSLGDTLLVVSAMKMETMLTASCAGLVTAMQPLQVRGYRRRRTSGSSRVSFAGPLPTVTTHKE